MKDRNIQLNVDTDRTVLYDGSVLYKTENFIKQTKYIVNIDFLLSKIAETIILNLKEFDEYKNQNDDVECFFVQTLDKQFGFFIKFGQMIDDSFLKNDLIFFDTILEHKKIRQNDQRINDFLVTNHTFDIIVSKSRKLSKEEDFKKLYHIFNVSGVNLPKLDMDQKQIVETVDKNVLVQGVAGSGKTNICIDKIIFSACQNYSGKVLYSTYSRGLLLDTKLKIENYKDELVRFINQAENGKVVFVGSDKKKALENKFGITFFTDDNDEIYKKISQIIDFLDKKVDCFLIEDLFKRKFRDDCQFFTERDFVQEYAKNVSNYQITKAFSKLNKYSNEIIYKEIFGMIFGRLNETNINQIMPLNQYIDERKNSFSKEDCELIYSIAKDFKMYIERNNKIDNNVASRKLLNSGCEQEYSLIVLDEVQDFTEINLYLFKQMSLKMFCVGDALQMINPSFFSFGFLKNLLFVKDVTAVSELKNNYRNTKKIAEIVNNLSDLNKKMFGTHNFLLNGVGVDSGVNTQTVYVKDAGFIEKIANSKFDNFTFIVSNAKTKNELKNLNLNQEILTVSEIKGLERGTVVAYNLLSDNIEKWELLHSKELNHKLADENSVYRYYYNLFYVGISRARQNLFVIESKQVPQFTQFFNENFEVANSSGAMKLLNEIVSKIEFTDAEVLERVQEFIRLEQYENAIFAANKIKDDIVRLGELNRIKIHENYIHLGKYHDAGIKFWELGMTDDAKKQFILADEKKLADFVDACSNGNEGQLKVDIIQYLTEFEDNEIAKKVIFDTLKNDLNTLKMSFKNIKDNFKRIDGNGK